MTRSRSTARRVRGPLALVTALATVLLGLVVPAVGSAAVTDTFTGSVTSESAAGSFTVHPFQVTAPGRRTITLDWDAAAANLDVGLRNPAGTYVRWTSSPTARPEVLVWDVDVVGTWTIAVKAKAGGAVNYTATVDDTPAPTCAGTVCGSLAGPGTATHTFRTTAEGTVTAVLDWANPAANLDVTLRDPAGRFTRITTSTTARPEHTVAVGGAVGTWTVQVTSRSGASAYAVDLTHSGARAASPASGARLASVFGFGPKDEGHAGLYGYGTDFDVTSNTVVVADIWNHRIVRYDIDGRRVPGFEIRTAGAAGVVEPFDVDVAPDGTIWVGNEAYSRIDHFRADGSHIKSIGVQGSPGLAYPRGCGAGSQYWPTNVVAHPNGKLYVSDGYCRDISIFDQATGVFERAIGMRPADFGVPKLTPRGLDVDRAGNLVVVEHQSRRIAKYTAAGALLPGFPTPANTTMLDPRGLAVDQTTGKMYVAAALNNQVYTFDEQGVPGARWTRPGVGEEFNSIRYVAAHAGQVFVGDTWGHRVWRLDASATGSTAVQLPWASGAEPAPDGGFNQVSGADVDPDTGKLFIVDTFENRGQGFNTRTAAGGLSWCVTAANCPAYAVQFGGREANSVASEGFNYPRALAVGGGSVWADGGQSLVRHALDGRFLSRFGTAGIQPGQFKLGPTGIDIVPNGPDAGTVWTSEIGNCRIQGLSYSGAPLKQYGACGTGIGQLQTPWQLDEHAGTLYVVDAARRSVFGYNAGTGALVSTVSGNWDGLALNAPKGVAIDPSGTWMYIADSGNKRIVRFKLDGSAVRQVVTKGADTAEGSFSLPRYLSFSSDGLLYVSDFHQRVYAFRVAA